jgi:hypothetical protein
MKIASSNIEMASARTFVQVDEKSEELEMWVGRRPSRANTTPSAVGPEGLRDRVTLSRPVHTDPMPQKGRSEGLEAADESDESDEEELLGAKLYLMKKFVESLTGQKIRIFKPSDMEQGSKDVDVPENQRAEGDAAPQNQGWSISYDSHESHFESEQTAFAAQGIIKTADGKEINFSLQLQMSREFYQESTESLRAGDAVQKTDPLVINFDGAAAELTDVKFAFDLDSDGAQENISFVRPGSGFLVLDKNRDGVVNDGSELFGPATGNGLNELAAFDEDGNSWIDENDSIYNNLSVWTKDAAGTDLLSSLKEKGVGAIYLSQLDTQFDLKDPSNQLNGQISRTGIYADEDGAVKTIQQVDLVV